MLEAKTIYLRPIQIEDAEGNYPEWFNDPEVCRYNSHGVVRNTKQRTLEYIRTAQASDTLCVLAIVDKASDRHIGNVSLQNIDREQQRGELAIIIGEKEFWGRGVGKEAWSLAMRYGFEELKLHRIHCGTRADNLSMQKLALATGMREEGRLRDHIFKAGKFHDVLLYGITRKDVR